MSSFTVFEEPANPLAESRTEFACQTEEIATAEQNTQTLEEALSNDENLKDSSGDERVSYLEAAVTNWKAEIKRFKQINDEFEVEKTQKMLDLEHKKEEYDRLFEIANEKLSKNNQEAEDEEEGENEEGEDRDCK